MGQQPNSETTKNRRITDVQPPLAARAAALMRGNLASALAFIDADEGPELNIAASEPGGSSKHGVSMTVLREWHIEKGLPPPTMDDMRAVESVLAGTIYTEKFALPIRFDDLPAGPDYRLLDIAVNLGVTGGIHTIQEALGLPHGPMDAATLHAANSTDPRALVLALGAAWLANKRANGGWAKYGPGWTNRANRAEARALAMLTKQPTAIAVPAIPIKTTTQGAIMTAWPKDNTDAKNAFYGDFHASDWQTKFLTRITPPFKMFYDKKPMPSILVNRMCAPELLSAFNEIWNACGHDQKKVDATGASDFGGCFNIRPIAGSHNWSNHSWACAIDLSPGSNGFNVQKTTLGKIVVDTFKAHGARWGGDYKGRKDPMHFEFVSP